MKKPVTLTRHRLSSQSPGSKALQGVQQGLVLLRGTDGDTQELGDARLLEVTHDYPCSRSPAARVAASLSG